MKGKSSSENGTECFARITNIMSPTIYRTAKVSLFLVCEVGSNIQGHYYERILSNYLLSTSKIQFTNLIVPMLFMKLGKLFLATKEYQYLRVNGREYNIIFSLI